MNRIRANLCRAILIVIPQFVINYLWNSGFAYGETHGRDEGMEIMRDKSKRLVKLAVACGYCHKCKGLHTYPYVDLEKWFSDPPREYTIFQNLHEDF